MKMPLMDQNPAYAGYKVGRYSYGSPKIERYGTPNTVEIGSFCSFGRDVTILISGEHPVDWVTTSPLVNLLPCSRRFRLSHQSNGSKGSVVIGNAVWVGMRSIILGGVTIGDGAIIGAGSVVTRSVPPYSICAGSPAKFRRWRFNDLRPAARVALATIKADTAESMPKIIERLCLVKWWDWPDERIHRNIELLLSDRVEEFIEKAEAEDAGVS